MADSFRMRVSTARPPRGASDAQFGLNFSSVSSARHRPGASGAGEFLISSVSMFVSKFYDAAVGVGLCFQTIGADPSGLLHPMTRFLNSLSRTDTTYTACCQMSEFPSTK